MTKKIAPEVATMPVTSNPLRELVKEKQEKQRQQLEQQQEMEIALNVLAERLKITESRAQPISAYAEIGGSSIPINLQVVAKRIEQHKEKISKLQKDIQAMSSPQQNAQRQLDGISARIAGLESSLEALKKPAPIEKDNDDRLCM